MNKTEVAIVIPLSTKPGFTEAEKQSLKHLEHYLGHYDKYFLAPEKLEIDYKKIPVLRFDDRYFGSLDAHNRFSLSKDYYNRFEDYKFVMMHHLDCLVFDDNLSKWCAMEYDFIGTPWVKGPDLPWLKKEGVGNGGLSLRKVKTFQKLLNSDVRWEGPNSKFQKVKKSKSMSDIVHNGYHLLTCLIPSMNNIHTHIDSFVEENNEDRFLYHFSNKYYPGFKTAPIDVALKFGFEANPRLCFERNNRELPFGCHAWEKYDREFWEPYLLR